MARHADPIRLLLAQGPMAARQIVEKTGISQPTVSRALAALGDEVVRIGAGSAIRYALRDPARGFASVPIYRVGDEGLIRELGTLVPVRPGGFVMIQADGVTLHTEGLPWWLLDMRPQGYLGRAYASTHAAALGLPANLEHWGDAEVIRALLAHGHDAIGNLLIGELGATVLLACRLRRQLTGLGTIPPLRAPPVPGMFPGRLPVVSNPSFVPTRNAVMCW
jgi:DNA-binding transcriptional ArsR family regulator